MNLVLLADDAFSFLLSWEVMSVASWALVMSHPTEGDNARAGFIYIVMASFGTAALLLAFGLLTGAEGTISSQPSGSSVIRSWHPLSCSSLPCWVLARRRVWFPACLAAARASGGTKSRLALMSGVMTKVAVYGFIRIAMDLLGSPQWWWAIAVLSIGAITAVLGVLHATMENDKRLLAYSTVENIGFVFIGLALTLAFSANGLSAAAALALTAALRAW